MRQFYVAVGASDVKLATLVDLLQALFANGNRSLAICCNSRDTLDNVIHAIAATKLHSIFTLFSEMTLSEKKDVLTQFQVFINQFGIAEGPKDSLNQTGDLPQSCVLVTTDFALADIQDSLILDTAINFDLPRTKEMMNRRFGALFGTNKNTDSQLVINFIVAGAIDKFRTYEEMCDQPIEVMPLHVADIFCSTTNP